MLDLMKKKNVSKKYVKWQKNFVNGDQFTAFNHYSGEVEAVDRFFYWQSQRVFNLIKPIVDNWQSLYSKGIWGKGKAVDQLIDYQIQYNSYMNRVNEMSARMCSAILCVEDGSVDVDELSEEGLSPGKILVYRRGGRCPALLGTHSKEDIETIYALAQNIKVELQNLAIQLEANLNYENTSKVDYAVSEQN